MSNSMSSQALDDATSYTVPLSNYDTLGLCKNYTLRRHKWEAEANAGSQEARSDWIKYIGPIEDFGTCNPINGNHPAISLPFTKPERLSVIAYMMEYLFLDDTNVDNNRPDHDYYDHDRHEWKNVAQGRAHIQVKMLTQLASIDNRCAGRVKRTLGEMSAVIKRDKDKHFESMERYLDFRMVDSAAPLLEALLLFGMGVTLTEEEDAKLEPLRRPCFLAIGLANDYLSFDREYLEFSETVETQTLNNAVWLYMQLHHVDVSAAKRMVMDMTRQQEDEFLEKRARFRRENKDISEKMNRHLEALAYQISGNLVWSLNCPRYRPDYRYDPNAGIEDVLTAKSMPEILGINYEARLVHKEKESSDQQVDMGSDPNNGHTRKASTESYHTATTDTEPATNGDISPSSLQETQQLGPEAVKIVLEELSELHIGQSYDLYWTQHSCCPSEDEYLEMVSKKTGGLFRLIVRLLLDGSESKAPKGHLHTDMGHLASLIGIQYQIRDDYQNLYCPDYGVQKGFCQDLDEGKFSFPLLHALSVQPSSKKLLCELIQRRRDAGCLSYEQKMLALKQLDCAGSMVYTRETLKRLQGEVYKDVKKIEDMTGKENWVLRALLQKLEIQG
ncbi:geranylgeranyl pyrophosphate synthetase [Pyrenophora teres f. maculata]|nr:geranylgeranyl pyrophosphate synthetase [Pyrenophora teres f. maculata]